MADNVTLPGTGKIIAAEEIAGVDYQRMKVVNGTAGSTTPLIVEDDGSIKMGTDITTPAAMPTGGVGVRGWLSAIFTSIGITTAAVWDGAAAASSVMSYLRYQGIKLEAIRALLAGNLGVVVQNASIAVTGAFYQVTQPISGAVTATVGVKATLWQNAPVSRGTVLTTELNSLANGAYSSPGPAYDNTANGDQYGAIEVVLATLTPTTNATVSFYLVQSLDGNNYEDAPSSTNPGTHMLVATVNLNAASGAKRAMSNWFYLPPGKFKVVALDSAGAALNGSGNTATLYTDNDEAQ